MHLKDLQHKNKILFIMNLHIEWEVPVSTKPIKTAVRNTSYLYVCGMTVFKKTFLARLGDRLAICSDHTIGRENNREQVRIWKGAVMVYLKVCLFIVSAVMNLRVP
jgi:hypothetical protein